MHLLRSATKDGQWIHAIHPAPGVIRQAMMDRKLRRYTTTSGIEKNNTAPVDRLNLSINSGRTEDKEGYYPTFRSWSECGGVRSWDDKG